MARGCRAGLCRTNLENSYRSPNKSSPKNLILTRSKAQPWISARVISSNLVESYSGCGRQSQFVFYDLDSSQPFSPSLSRTSDLPSVTKVIFTESKPNPLNAVKLIMSKLPKLDQFIFHVYGNFSCQTPEWLELFQLLRGKKANLIVFSEAQRGHIRGFLNRSSWDSVLVLPPPLEPHCLRFDRAQARADLKLHDGEFVIIYSGRISLMKNVNSLIELVSSFGQGLNHKSRIKLLIAGDIDNFVGNVGSMLPNEFYIRWNDWYRSLPQTIRRQIVLLGQLSRNELEKVHLASDLYINLSTYHDEDLGLSPMEALQQGTPAILSGWGGFLQYEGYPRDVRLLRVRSRLKSFFISQKAFNSALSYFIRQSAGQRDQDRLVRRQFFLEAYSRKRLEVGYKELLEGPVIGRLCPSSFLLQHSRLVKDWRQFHKSPYCRLDSKDLNYWRTYRSYFRDQSVFLKGRK